MTAPSTWQPWDFTARPKATAEVLAKCRAISEANFEYAIAAVRRIADDGEDMSGAGGDDHGAIHRKCRGASRGEGPSAGSASLEVGGARGSANLTARVRREEPGGQGAYNPTKFGGIISIA
jgi:hypothetical protein